MEVGAVKVLVEEQKSTRFHSLCSSRHSASSHFKDLAKGRCFNCLSKVTSKYLVEIRHAAGGVGTVATSPYAQSDSIEGEPILLIFIYHLPIFVKICNFQK
jgi:hypothetical protein